MSTQIKQTIQSGLPTLAVDVPDAAFEAMSKNSAWTTDDNPEAWKTIYTSFPAQQTAYAYQIREAIEKRKEDGCKFVLLFAVRSERVCLLDLA
jgi:eukaryotic translation initiation factor 2-alpha kinase 4